MYGVLIIADNTKIEIKRTSLLYSHKYGFMKAIRMY